MSSHGTMGPRTRRDTDDHQKGPGQRATESQEVWHILVGKDQRSFQKFMWDKATYRAIETPCLSVEQFEVRTKFQQDQDRPMHPTMQGRRQSSTKKRARSLAGDHARIHRASTLCAFNHPERLSIEAGAYFQWMRDQATFEQLKWH